MDQEHPQRLLMEGDDWITLLTPELNRAYLVGFTPPGSGIAYLVSFTPATRDELTDKTDLLFRDIFFSQFHRVIPFISRDITKNIVDFTMNNFNDYIYRDEHYELHYVSFKGSDMIDIPIEIVPNGDMDPEEKSMILEEGEKVRERILREANTYPRNMKAKRPRRAPQ